MKKLLACGAAIAALAAAGSASATLPPFPGIGADTQGPSLIITLNLDGSVTASAGLGPCPTYDSCNSDDTYIGVINNTTSSVGSIHLSSFTPIFGFEDDGIDESNYLNIPHNAKDPSGYGGPHGYFTGIGFNNTVGNFGDVNFIGGIAGNGGWDYFSLEDKVLVSSFTAPITTTPGGVPEPATWGMMLLGFFGLGGMVRAKRRTVAVA